MIPLLRNYIPEGFLVRQFPWNMYAMPLFMQLYISCLHRIQPNVDHHNTDFLRSNAVLGGTPFGAVLRWCKCNIRRNTRREEKRHRLYSSGIQNLQATPGLDPLHRSSSQFHFHQLSEAFVWVIPVLFKVNLPHSDVTGSKASSIGHSSNWISLFSSHSQKW